MNTTIKKRLKNLSLIVVIILSIAVTIYLITKDKKEEQIVSEALNLVNVSPPEGKNPTIFTSTGILFQFDSILDTSSAQVTIEPSIEIITSLSIHGSDILVVRPMDQWELDKEYTITIKKGLKAMGNMELKEDIIYSFEYFAPTQIRHDY